MNLISIANNGSAAVLNPLGGHLNSWTVGGRNLFLPVKPDFPGRCTHPCGPAFGLSALADRTKPDGKYQVGGKTYQLPLHGVLRDIEGRPTAEDQAVGLTLKNVQGDPEFNPEMLAQQYPFQFSAQLEVALTTPRSLNWQLAFTNLSQGTVAPVDLACHNYFPWEEGFYIKGLDGLEYDDFSDLSQVSRQILQSSDIFKYAGLKDWQFDLAVPDGTLKRNFQLVYPQSKFSIIMSVSSEYPARKLVVWQNPEAWFGKIGPYICVEPVKCGRFSLNDETTDWVPYNETSALAFFLLFCPEPPRR